MDKDKMQPIIGRIDRDLILKELTPDKFVRTTRRGGNKIYEVTAADSPNVMQEIGRTREVSFRTAGGGTGLAADIDEFDIDKDNPYRQLIVWDPEEQEIIGGYRYLLCGGVSPEKMATKELFTFSDKFAKEILPVTIELGRSYVQPMYQRLNLRRKGIYAVDNLWDGLGALMVKYPEYKYFFGKVTMYKSYNVKARNILLNFMRIYFPDPDKFVTCIEPLDTDEGNPEYAGMFAGMDVTEAFRKAQHEIRNRGEQVPPLINSYITLSDTMRTFGTCNNYGFGGVEETGILIYIPDIKEDKTERHIQPLRDLADRLLSNWFKGKEILQRNAEATTQNWKRSVGRMRKYINSNLENKTVKDGPKKKRENRIRLRMRNRKRNQEE